MSPYQTLTILTTLSLQTYNPTLINISSSNLHKLQRPKQTVVQYQVRKLF